MFNPDWLILRILHQSFEIERPKGHWSEVVVHLYVQRLCFFTKHMQKYCALFTHETAEKKYPNIDVNIMFDDRS